jgi:hypothetical protein
MYRNVKLSMTLGFKIELKPETEEFKILIALKCLMEYSMHKLAIRKYRCAPVSTDSVSVVHCGPPPPKLENKKNKWSISFKTPAKQERAVTR